MVISILIVILGLLSLQTIPVAKYPEITPPMVQVVANYSGANAVNMEQAVATPIEQQVNGVEKMLYMKSVNANNGSMVLQVSFDVGTDLDNANMLTQNRVTTANPFLPAEVKNLGVNVKNRTPFRSCYFPSTHRKAHTIMISSTTMYLSISLISSKGLKEWATPLSWADRNMPCAYG